MSSPRPWGCFSNPDLFVSITLVFPTPVGVFLAPFLWWLYSESLPHARGGVSDSTNGLLTIGASSPRPWGCFYGEIGDEDIISVFPTPVGVFLF